MHKTLAFFFITLLFLNSPSVRAQAPEEDPYEALLAKLRSIEERIQRMEANQQEILAREERILAELDRVRIWSRRHG